MVSLVASVALVVLVALVSLVALVVSVFLLQDISNYQAIYVKNISSGITGIYTSNRPSSIYSWSIGHILEHEFFCLGSLGCAGSKGKKSGFEFF